MNLNKYIFYFLLLICFLASPFGTSWAQFGNEWIQPGQTYYKIKVGQTGLYALKLDQLRNAGIPVSPSGSVLPSELQLYYRGIEQAIQIQNDSLFFFGKMNDGTLDSLLYRQPGTQPHKYYNLYSDTSTYFITWKSGVNGKRMDVLSLSSSAPAEPYHTEESLNVFTDWYEFGYRYSVTTYMTYADKGEGWMGGVSGSGGSIFQVVLTPENVYTSVALTNVEFVLVGRNGFPGGNIHLIDMIFSNGVDPDITYSVTPFAYHDIQKVNTTIPTSFLTKGNVTVTVMNNGNGVNPSMVSLTYLKVNYPQLVDMDNKSWKYFTVPSNGSSANLMIADPSAGTRLFDITDENNIDIISTTTVGGQLKGVIPSSVSGRKVFAVTPSSYLSVSDIQKADLLPFSNISSAEYIIISNYKIMSGARDYATYRASVAGGGYDTLVAEIHKVYDMFTYGEKSPVAIRRLMSYLFDEGDPQYLFIVGKGLVLDYYVAAPYYYRKDPASYINHPNSGFRREDLVPTYGVPGSDLLYVNGLNGKPENVPAIPVGRVAAKTTQEVLNYLNKVKEHEATPNALWRKNLIHLSGGNTEGEKSVFLNNVNNFKRIAEDTIFGGKVVKTFSKKGSDAVDNELISSVADEINKGVSYVTFFGHSAPAVTDLDIGFVSMDFYGYRNKGKYPMLIINGCGSAQIFARQSFSEDWIITADRGAIVTLGHTDAGYAEELKNYSTLFYKNAFQKRSMAGRPVGDVHLQTIQDFNTAYGFSGAVATATLHQMILHGDPAVRVYTPELPDYFIDDTRLSIRSLEEGHNVTAVSDSFAVSIIVANLGLNFNDSVQVRIRRVVNGKEYIYGPKSFASINYEDTIDFVIKSPSIDYYGENLFEVYIDPLDSIAETNELNNVATLRYFMPLSGVTALFPREYSIVNSNPVTFIAQSTNLLVGTTEYKIELDTSYLFNSVVKKEAVITAGALVKWENVNLPVLQDSLVYYWRVRYNTIGAGEDTLYGESSFIYINGSPEGWSQSEFPQFFKDGITHVKRNIPSREWEFEETQTNIYVKAAANGYVDPNPFFNPAFINSVVSINGVLYEFRTACATHSMLAITFNKNTVQPYTPYGETEGGSPCGVTKPLLNTFNELYDPTSPANPSNAGQNQANLMEYMDHVPDGDYVLFLNKGNAYFSLWSTELKDKFKNEFGADSIDFLSNEMAYVLLAQKGNPDPVFEKYGDVFSLIEYSDTLRGAHDKGYITSTLIGPASQTGNSYSWGTLYRTVKATEVPVTDSYELKIIGVDMGGNAVDTLSITQIDTLQLSTVAGLDQYPYIRLYAEVEDEENLTVPQLEKWQVIYSTVPEGTMNAELIGLSAYTSKLLAEGDSITVCYAFENISEKDFTDTLSVKFTMVNVSGVSTSETVKLKPLKQDSVVTFCHNFKTKGYPGINVLQAYVNPRILPEQYYNNNVLQMTIEVERDIIHPVLDVVFDGAHIMNGDIVSPSPVITITLNDENTKLIRTNNEGMYVFLQKPGDEVPQLIDLGGSSIISAQQVGNNGKNVYQIEYRPENLPDGIYTLVVRAQDVAGNESGVEDYQISFEVINSSTITNFYPYPNPFSSSTRFVFTLTGNEVPQDLKIQVMTVTGKVVREITKAEIGPIRIGHNKTEYAWDGTDEFGDKLANGVYLYRVVIKGAGDFQHRETGGDKAFHKNFGKLYILR